MSENKIPFEERDGTLFRAYEVENGLRCGCICPGCRQPLNAANNGEKVAPHFRHAQSNDCTDGFREGVRRAAVALIAQHKQLMLPAFLGKARVTTASGRILEKDAELKPAMATANSVERFVDLDGLRGHAVLHQSDRQLIVRIKLSPRMEYERYSQLQAMEHSSMEIDLHRLTLEQINDPATFAHAVLQDPNTRTWIRSIRGERLLVSAKQQLQSQAAELNARWLQEKAKRDAAEKARQLALATEKTERELALQAHRAMQVEMASQRSAIEPDTTAQGRADLIAANMMKAIREWGGKAVECTACHLLSPPDFRFCLYCTVDTSKVHPVSLPADIASTIHKRMHCSAKPSMSIKVAPQLIVLPDIEVV